MYFFNPFKFFLLCSFFSPFSTCPSHQMKDYPYPSPSPARDGPHSRPVSVSPAGSSRHCGRRRMSEDEVYGDPIKCTGKSCKSCTAGLIADCVAVCCCCPCAVVNILVFAFLKVPWMVGRRILKLGRHNRSRRKKKKKKKKKCCPEEDEEEEWECGAADIDGNSRKAGGFSESELSGFGFGFGYDDEELRNGDFSARFEAEQEVWFELHQVGHLGFGRVSFTGIQIPCG